MFVFWRVRTLYLCGREWVIMKGNPTWSRKASTKGPFAPVKNASFNLGAVKKRKIASADKEISAYSKRVAKAPTKQVKEVALHNFSHAQDSPQFDKEQIFHRSIGHPHNFPETYWSHGHYPHQLKEKALDREFRKRTGKNVYDVRDG